MIQKQHKSKDLLSNERGVALLMTLVLSAITLGITAGVLYMVTGGTQMSGTQKRYKTALEAGLGGTSVMFEVIRAGGTDPGLGLDYIDTSACLNEKLDDTTSSANWGSCTDYDKATSLTIDTSEQPSDPPQTYDVSFTLGTGAEFRASQSAVWSTTRPVSWQLPRCPICIPWRYRPKRLETLEKQMRMSWKGQRSLYSTSTDSSPLRFLNERIE
jgi:hypothetical protein